MAGLGSRFSDAGYKEPKPFVDVAGRTMISRVLNNLKYDGARYILLARQEHLLNYQDYVVEIQKEFDVVFVPIDMLTEGTACTVLFARKYINNDAPLIIANSDQIVDISIPQFIEDCLNSEYDGSILTFIEESRDPKWSYAKVDENGAVLEVKEKVPVSKYATVGIYMYNRGRDYVDSAIDMMIRRDKVNSEYYTCPTYNYLIANGLRAKIYNIPREKMHGIGTPDDLNKYIGNLRKNAALS
jgi:dTDP-glucose pyrophosphorylase